MDGFYWSHEACGWVRSPCAGDALATPWAGHDVPVPAPLALRDAWDVIGAFPPLPPVPGMREPAAAPEGAPLET